MFVDARDLNAGTVVRTNVCIVGAGSAGLSVATELMKSGLSVALLESGGLDTDQDDLGAVASTTEFPGQLGIWCRRQFGGNANKWHINPGPGPQFVRMVPYAAGDFEPRPWIEDSDWPIRRPEIESYYDRAQVWLDLPGRSFDGEAWHSEETPMLPLEGTGLRTVMYQFPDRDTLLRDHRTALQASDNVTTYYHATAAEIETDEGGQEVTGVRVMAAPGHELTFKADLVVLAQGLANPQLLLASTKHHANGIGNQHDQVGRYFNDHPLLMGGNLTLYSPELMDRMSLYDLRLVNGRGALGHLELSDETLRTEECSNLSFIMYPRNLMSPRKTAGYTASLRLRDAFRERRMPPVGDVAAEIGRAHV
jgi:choline dehydrogenase-like flavoprotein